MTMSYKTCKKIHFLESSRRALGDEGDEEVHVIDEGVVVGSR